MVMLMLGEEDRAAVDEALSGVKEIFPGLFER
jgi:hypothetical protein